MEYEREFIRAKLVIFLLLQSCLMKKKKNFEIYFCYYYHITAYDEHLLSSCRVTSTKTTWEEFTETFNCFAALRKLREFDAKQPFNEEETRGMFHCFFSNWHPIQNKDFPKNAYHLNNCIFQLYTAWRSTILDGYTTQTKNQVSRMLRGFLNYFTKTHENAHKSSHILTCKVQSCKL